MSENETRFVATLSCSLRLDSSTAYSWSRRPWKADRLNLHMNLLTFAYLEARR